MDILPPRRRGQLGAFSVGNGAPGSSGGFSIAASSTAKPSSSPAPAKSSTPAKGSVTPAAAKSVSEQVALQQSSSQKAAAKTTPGSGNADVFGKPAVVGVQPYAPPKGTPAVTQPPKQPNEPIAVAQLAKQVPQTKEQVIQKVLAQDAGIAVPVKGPPPIIPVNPPLKPVPVGTIEQDEASLFKAITQATGVPPMPGVVGWARARRQGVALRVMRDAIPKAVAEYLGKPTMATVAKMMADWISVIEARDNKPGTIVPVNATTSSSIPPSPKGPAVVAPVITPAVVKTANAATVAQVAAKVADQVAGTKAVVADQKATQAAVAAVTANKIDSVAKATAVTAQKAAEEHAAAAQNALVVVNSQTASDDAKAKAQAELRTAAEARALAEKQAADAAAAKAQADAIAAKTQAEADKAAADAAAAAETADKKAAEAQKVTEVAVQVQQQAATATSESGGAQIIPFPGSNGGGGGAADPGVTSQTQALTKIDPQPTEGSGDLQLPVFHVLDDKKPESGFPWGTVLLGLVAVGAVVYATRAGSLNGAPLIADLGEDED